MAPSERPRVVISGSGLWTPAHVITNEELVASYNAWADRYNQIHAAAIADGQMEAKPEGSAAFIEKAAGIKQRFVYAKEGTLDIDRMRPSIPERPEEALSDQAEIAIDAGRQAMAAAGKTGADIDAVIVSCAYTQRAYPAIAIEVQEALGIDGFGFDMLVACSAATFGLHRAYEMVAAGTARCVLAINPELITPQVNYCDRDSHFIFGDVATAALWNGPTPAPAPTVSMSSACRPRPAFRATCVRTSATSAEPTTWIPLARTSCFIKTAVGFSRKSAPWPSSTC
ncbi:beta-ketoacyl-ACP synthase III [Desulfosarcina cetonica]|uniref:beta-ketoacyl-ACP synthase III n=1 Tax=Desulfosarcina cetonica TaxID=90730 RepID=UPI000ABA7563|nr:beta-ketoacyl-ACP synthase III [Desulfosarcina cetonica]